MFRIIGAVFGYFVGNIGGAIIGFIIGAIIDAFRNMKVTRVGFFTNQDNFINMLLILTSAVVKSNNTKNMAHSELNYVRDYLLKTFGPDRATNALYELRDLLDQDFDIPTICHDFSNKATIHEKLLMLQFLFGLSASDGNFSNQESTMLRNIADWMGVSRSDFESVKAMFFARQYQYQQQQQYQQQYRQDQYRQQSSQSNYSYTNSYTIENDYKMLEITSTASDEDVKKAYRKLAMKHHPDKVNHLGDDLRKTAEEKFRLLNQAYERIKKQRGIN